MVDPMLLCYPTFLKWVSYYQLLLTGSSLFLDNSFRGTLMKLIPYASFKVYAQIFGGGKPAHSIHFVYYVLSLDSCILKVLSSFFKQMSRNTFFNIKLQTLSDFWKPKTWTKLISVPIFFFSCRKYSGGEMMCFSCCIWIFKNPCHPPKSLHRTKYWYPDLFSCKFYSELICMVKFETI